MTERLTLSLSLSCIYIYIFRASQVTLVIKNPPASAGDVETCV